MTRRGDCPQCHGTGRVAFGPDNGHCWKCNPPAKRWKALQGAEAHDAYAEAARAAMEREAAAGLHR